MEELGLNQAGLLIAGGFVAGVVNTLAGGGSLLTVPLLVLMGLPGTVANGTNRVGIVFQCVVAAWHFREIQTHKRFERLSPKRQFDKLGCRETSIVTLCLQRRRVLNQVDVD